MSRYQRISSRPSSDWQTKVSGKGWCAWTQTPDGDHGGNYLEGVYYLPEGIVSIYMQGGTPDRANHTQIGFVHRGYKYARTWQCRFTKPTILRLARQFVAEIISKEKHRP